MAVHERILVFRVAHDVVHCEPFVRRRNASGFAPTVKFTPHGLQVFVPVLGQNTTLHDFVDQNVTRNVTIDTQVQPVHWVVDVTVLIQTVGLQH